MSDPEIELNDAFDSMAKTALRIRDERDALQAREKALISVLEKLRPRVWGDERDLIDSTLSWFRARGEL